MNLCVGGDYEDLIMVQLTRQVFNNLSREQMYTKYRVIRNDCRGFDNFSYTIHLR